MAPTLLHLLTAVVAMAAGVAAVAVAVGVIVAAVVVAAQPHHLREKVR